MGKTCIAFAACPRQTAARTACQVQTGNYNDGFRC
jgi:hypothetical protein